MPVDTDRLSRMESLLDTLVREFGELKGDLRVLNDRSARELPALAEKVSRHDGEIQELQRWKAWVFGVAAATSVISGVGTTLLLRMLYH